MDLEQIRSRNLLLLRPTPVSHVWWADTGCVGGGRRSGQNVGGCSDQPRQTKNGLSGSYRPLQTVINVGC